MSNKYEWPKDFRMTVLALMLDDFWVAKYGEDIVWPEYFEEDSEEEIARAIIDFRKAYKKSPKDPDSILIMMKGEYEDAVFDVFDRRDELSEKDIEFVSDLIIQFAKEQAVKLAILDSIDDVNRGRLASLPEKMAKALSVGESLLSPGIDPIRDVDKWLYDIWVEKVPTRLTHVDYLLEGGLGVPELGIILGPTNRGKSMALVSIGYGAASIGSGKNVVHFTHEMGVDKVAKRYAARMLFRFPKVGENLSKYEDDLIETARKLLPGKIRIIGGAKKMSVDEMDHHLSILRSEGFDIGLVISDYPDLLVPPRSYHERRFELSAIYELLREISEKYNCPIWGATQGNRGSLSKEIITLQDIAEDIGKANISDVIVALCQTSEEYEANKCRLFMAKVRDTPGKNKSVDAKYYGESQAIVTTGYTKKEEEQDV